MAVLHDVRYDTVHDINFATATNLFTCIFLLLDA